MGVVETDDSAHAQQHEFAASETVWEEQSGNPPAERSANVAGVQCNLTVWNLLPSVVALLIFVAVLGFATIIGLASGGLLLPLWVAMAFVPGAFLIAVVYLPRLDSVDWNKVLLFFFIGTISTLVAFGLETGLSYLFLFITSLLLAVGFPENLAVLLYVFLFAFIVAALVEELIKYSMSLMCTIRTSTRSMVYSPWGYLVLSLAAAVGFATAENVEYVLSTFLNPDIAVLATTRGARYQIIIESIGRNAVAAAGASDLTMILLLIERGLMSVPLHAFTGISYGSDGCRIFFAAPEKNWVSVLSRIAHMMWLTVTIHGTYDFVLMMGAAYGVSILIWVAIAIAVVVWVLMVYKVRCVRLFERNEYAARLAGDASDTAGGEQMYDVAGGTPGNV